MATHHNTNRSKEDGESSSALAICEFNVRSLDGPAVLLPRQRLKLTWGAHIKATAFGGLWFSSHPGTSSMGKLLAISLMTTMAAAALFQPILMGKPRQSLKD